MAISEGPPVREPLAVDHVVHVDGGGLRLVDGEVVPVTHAGVSLHGAGVGYVEEGVVWAEAQAVALREAVGHGPDLAGGGPEAEHLDGHFGVWAEALEVAIVWICEPELCCINEMKTSSSAIRPRKKTYHISPVWWFSTTSLTLENSLP